MFVRSELILIAIASSRSGLFDLRIRGEGGTSRKCGSVLGGILKMDTRIIMKVKVTIYKNGMFVKCLFILISVSR